METDGRQAKPGGAETETEDNVVRLPRDWLGPREDLIPFGPSAEAEDDGLATPPSTHDFWGEPAMGLWEPDADGAEPMPRRVVPGLPGAASFSGTLAGVAEHRRAAGITALIAASVLALVLAVGGSGSHRHQLSAATSRPAPPQTALTELTPGRALPSLVSKGRHPVGHRSSRGVRRRVKAPVKRHTVHRSSRHVTRAVTVQSVHYISPGATSGASSPSPSRPSTSTAPTGGTARTSAGPPSGSASQPALGAAGALAPGSSPDS